MLYISLTVSTEKDNGKPSVEPSVKSQRLLPCRVCSRGSVVPTVLAMANSSGRGTGAVEATSRDRGGR